MQTAITDVEQKQFIDHEVIPVGLRATGLVVKSIEERALLVTDIKNAEDLMERIEEKFHPTANKKAAYATYEAALDTEKQFYEGIKLFVSNGKKVVKTWDTNETLRIQKEQRDAQEKKEREEKAEKARKDAEAQAAIEEEERKQLAEFERLEKEKKEKLALQQSAAESGNSKVAGIAAKEVAKIEDKIADVQTQGAQKIEEIKAKAEEPTPAPMQPKFTPPPAPVKKLVWKARVTNLMKLCRSIGIGDVPFTVVEIRQGELNDFAKKYDGTTKIEGLEFYQESIGRM